MGKEKAVSGNTTIPLYARPLTRALASALRASSKLITSSDVAAITLINKGMVLRANSKRTALDDTTTNAPKKQRAVLKDISNVTCENSHTTSCASAAKTQVVYMHNAAFLKKIYQKICLLQLTVVVSFPFSKVENVKQIEKGRAGSSKVASSSTTSEVTDNAKSQVVSDSAGVSLSGCTGTNKASCSFSRLPPRPPVRSTSSTGKNFTSVLAYCCYVSGLLTLLILLNYCNIFTVETSSPKFIDIDSDVKDPLLCSLYAPEIHYNLRVAEVLITLLDFFDILGRTLHLVI